jgi:Lar family restriction alleviation protein
MTDQSERERVALLPCPFCGGEAEKVEAVEAGDQAYCICCRSCQASSKVIFFLMDDATDQLAHAWNTRADAALAEIGAVRVRELTWEAEDGRSTCLDAEGCDKLYRILIRQDGTAVLRHNASSFQQEEHESEEAAKAAANEDNRARILAAIEPAPVSARECPLGDDCDLTAAYMAGRGSVSVREAARVLLDADDLDLHLRTERGTLIHNGPVLRMCLRAIAEGKE